MSKGHSTFLEYRIYRKKFLGTIIVVIVLCLSAFSGVLFFFIRNWVNDVQIQSQYRFQQKERQLENVQTWTRSYVEGLYTDAALMEDLKALFGAVNNQDYIAKRRENSLNSDSEIRYVPADIKKLFLDGRTKICGVTLRSDNGIKALRMTNYDLWVDFECRTIEDVKTIPGFGDIMASSYSVRDPDTMSIFTSSKVLGFENDEILGPTGAVAIPEFNTRFTRGMLMDTMPQDFNTLVRLSGFSHGTDVWLGNARDLIVGGTASVLETVGCRDDIMLYLISMGLEPKMSFKIMEAVRKGKVKKKGFEDGWEEAMREHQVPDWYIGSLAKIGYLFPKAHAVAYVMMAFRIAWFKVHEPLAFYATFFSIRAKAFDAEYCCAGMDAVKQKIREIENNKDATDVEQNLLVTLEVCYEFYLRGFHFDTISIYDSDATHFKITENGLLPPFVTVRGLGETAALDTVEKRKGKTFISVEEFATICNKLSKTHIEQLKALGAFAGMADTSQVTLF